MEVRGGRGVAHNVPRVHAFATQQSDTWRSGSLLVFFRAVSPCAACMGCMHASDRVQDWARWLQDFGGSYRAAMIPVRSAEMP